ncbi:ras guanine nucleotide exchange factor Y [Cajanus cajan]|uniref:ras guanine nucleotide exchange factor Y n=1 Tax=Cajanus cajan TaxID=3821 RepID=UPI00098D8569|nr:ras guanine nucleotide exchange factor Y [Cajanus cajan]
MASSEVEIASSSPFGCVLRDRNHREACRESNVKGTHNAATFQRNINNFVIDLNTCMAVSSDSTTNENNNSSSSDSNNNNSKQRKSPKNNHLERLCLTRSKTFNNNNNDNDNNKDESSLASLISPRHSRLLDRWAAKQAREMVSNLENEAELLSMDDNDTLPRTSSSTSEESSSETRNMGASSLVQIWEKRLNKSGMSKTNMSVDRITSSSSPNAVNENESENESENENANAFSVEEQCFDGPSNEEPFPDWDSSDHSVSPGGRSEKDRVSVADIIRKLTTTKQNQSPTPSFVDENEHEGYGGSCSVTGSSVTSSPCRERECGGVSTQQHVEQNQRINFSLRIRGRQAYNELLMHMENDRHREVNNLAERGAVSRFAQRGRIQAVLRLRLLQREVAANDPSRQKSTESEVNNNRQPPGGSAIIMQLRERFSSGAELRTPVQTEVANARSPQRETVNNTPQLNNSATTKQLRKDKSNKTACGTSIHATQSTQKSVSQAKIDHNTEEAHPSSDVMVQETHPTSDVVVQEPHPSSDVKALHHDSKETTEATTTMIDSNLNDMVDRAETSNQQNAVAKSSNDKTVNEEEASNRQYVETSYLETVEEEPINENYSESSYDDEIEDEVEDIDHNCDETNYDWISEISRPRSYWEERRQEWYREMLETGSHNEDIRTLLERRTVSSFLSSDFREKMDRLMESHRGTQTHLVNIQDQQEDSQGMMAFLQEHLHSARASQEEGRDAGEEEEERRNQDEEEEEEEDEDNADEQEQEQEKEHEEESLISGSYHGVGDYSNRSSSWSYRDNETGDDFDRVDSTSPQTYQSRSFYPDSRQSPSTTHHSIEMELMYDLRGQMEQLYQEISELRKTIKGCVDMQMQLQQSMNQEVHPVKKEEKKPHKTPKKGNCCVCYEMKVDSVLYRCGHMCACLKCANELQWNSGKCPICRAKIVDVVRVYVDN